MNVRIITKNYPANLEKMVSHKVNFRAVWQRKSHGERVRVKKSILTAVKARGVDDKRGAIARAEGLLNRSRWVVALVRAQTIFVIVITVRH